MLQINCNWHGRRNQYLFYTSYLYFFIDLFTFKQRTNDWKRHFLNERRSKNGSTLPASHTVAKTNLDKYIVSIISKCLSHLISQLIFIICLCVLLQAKRDIDNKQTNPIKICWLTFFSLNFVCVCVCVW